MKQSIFEFLEAAAGALMIAGMVALYCWATPAQSSAVNDLYAEAEEVAE